MGLLDTILSTIDNKKRTFKRGVMDMLDNPKDWSEMTAARMNENMYGGPENWDAMKKYYQRQPYDKKLRDKALQSMTDNMINESLGAVTAWHGSPHKFDKFDMSKIGTGEGAQAYGHGIYAAESPEVAQMYRASVSAENGKSFGLDDGPIKGIATLIAAKGTKGEEMARKAYSGQVQDIDAAIKAAKEAVNNQSQLYKVDIPDEAVAKFLDWDKPLSQQAPEVQKAIRKEMPDYGLGTDKRKSADAYFELASRAIKQGHVGQNGEYVSLPAGFNEFDAASKRLQELGIPGIRYLDSGSRSSGQGSSNYVLFDDQLPRILERNGQPTGLQPWAKGEWKGLLSQ